MLLFFVSILVVMSSSLLYYAERGIYDSELGFWKRKIGSMCPYVCLQADPYLGCDYKGQVVDVVYNYERGPFGEMCHNLYEQSPFDSIVATFWVILQTVTVVGYGDVMILTPLGMAVGTLAVASGILTVAMPISIINTNFNAELRQFKVKMLFKSMRVRMQRAAAAAKIAWKGKETPTCGRDSWKFCTLPPVAPRLPASRRKGQAMPPACL